GGGPFGGLTLSASTLYETTDYGGTNESGTVFKINTDGSGYTVINYFGDTIGNGEAPSGDLTLSGSTLYGTTEFGGSNNLGTVFKINTDGSGYTVLKHFTSSAGTCPVARRGW